MKWRWILHIIINIIHIILYHDAPYYMYIWKGLNSKNRCYALTNCIIIILYNNNDETLAYTYYTYYIGTYVYYIHRTYRNALYSQCTYYYCYYVVYNAHKRAFIIYRYNIILSYMYRYLCVITNLGEKTWQSDIVRWIVEGDVCCRYLYNIYIAQQVFKIVLNNIIIRSCNRKADTNRCCYCRPARTDVCTAYNKFISLAKYANSKLNAPSSPHYPHRTHATVSYRNNIIYRAEGCSIAAAFECVVFRRSKNP